MKTQSRAFAKQNNKNVVPSKNEINKKVIKHMGKGSVEAYNYITASMWRCMNGRCNKDQVQLGLQCPVRREDSLLGMIFGMVGTFKGIVSFKKCLAY